MANVVLLMADEHNPFISSVYGHPFVQTPNMERLASEGTVFQNAYCASPLCLPTRASFMTGRYVHEIETFNNCKIFQREYSSYGGVLREQGVHTTYIGGGAALFCPPEELGFSEMLLAGELKVSRDTRFTRRPFAIRDERVLNRGFGPKEDAWKKDMRQIDRAVEWIQETAPTVQSPWTLTVNVTRPHFPLYARPDLWHSYDGRGDLPSLGTDEESSNHPYARDLRAHFRMDEFTEEQIRGMRQGYYACVSYVDQELGRLLDALEFTGQRENTVVVYTSDHGEMLGKFGMWWKSSLYEDSARIPLIAAGPGFESGAVVETPVSSLDLQAAIFHAVGKERPEPWRGEPLQQVPRQDENRVVFSEYHGHGVRSGAYMIRRGHWKLMYNMEAPHQLYNLQDDPDERVNVYEKRPDIAEALERELRKICNPEAVNEKAHALEKQQYEAVLQMLEQQA